MTAAEFSRYKRQHWPWYRRLPVSECINAALFAAVALIALLFADAMLHGAAMPDLVYGPR